MPVSGFTDLRTPSQRSPFDANNSRYGLLGDEFARTTLNPTGAIPYYTSTINVGTGTNAIAVSKDRLNMVTTAANGDNQEIRLDELVFQRKSIDSVIDGRSTFNLDVIFALSQATGMNFFIGIVNASSAVLSALPTTQGHMGVQFNDGASANFFLTSANGAAQVTTDCGAAGAANNTNFFRLNIQWTGVNAGIVSLFDEGTTNPTTSSTLIKSQTVSALAVTSLNFRAFLKTTVTLAKTVSIFGWQATIT